MKEAILSCTALTVNFGRASVLRGVDVIVNGGEVVHVVGPNGAGKSTLLRSLFGAVPASGGRVKYGDQDVTAWSPNRRVRRGLAHVPEARRIFPNLSVSQNLRVAADSCGASTSETYVRMERIWRYFPVLEAMQAKRGGDLSGGQQQMLAVGRALMVQPQVVLLDEPSLGLSPKATSELRASLEEIKRESGTSFLIAEQGLNSLESADRVYVLVLGKVVWEGHVAELSVQDITTAYFG